MEKILVSACLLGSPVRYNGSDRLVDHPLMALWREQGRIVQLCPEVAAGFPTPRPPAEIEPGLMADDVLVDKARIFDQTGADVTSPFRLGAEIALETALSQGCRFALLTDGSPSCGTSFVYSGHFDGVAREGAGVVAALLSQNGITVFSENQIGQLAEALDNPS
ncbi:DUF523 domain-containing protein [Hoeflea sp. G2-23]|uniref:DUF523 domain-containing protein n=1 Tax=Hoeflea algicola TaxID=2983763 RepID=A0ABT3Z7K5_9HYPH|nr:DUF523 domain-containing protein [Hoeflea algicola]MCY0147765.1 DUF523 domain-containing protein [Hoeflea algicola]